MGETSGPTGCGTTIAWAHRVPATLASSSRVVPAGPYRSLCEPLRRSIPAPAGEPCSLSGMPCVDRVYPRACGGTVTRRSKCSASTRSIPAPAGEPRWDRTSLTYMPVYPRACGGTMAAPARAPIAAGLSPRLRGNLGDVLLRGQELGSIPAPAGEPERLISSLPHYLVYPRACGGTPWPFPPTHYVGGLSPRLRGNPLMYSPLRLIKRSIPAPAGEPSFLCPYGPDLMVYPRACGGTNWNIVHSSSVRGLSPRLRGNRASTTTGTSAIGSIPAPAGGNQLEHRAFFVGQGSIPAPAGEPCFNYYGNIRHRVYPRACGGTGAEVEIP